MSRKRLAIILILSANLLLLAIFFAGFARPEELLRAFVVNLETPHPVRGEVSVVGVIQHASMVRIPDLVVSSVRREETARWTDAGAVETNGFTSLVVSVQGQVKGSVSRGGVIGAILVPDEEPITQALIEGEIQLPLEVVADVAPGGVAHFSASRGPLNIAFPRYRLYLYDSTDQTAAANVFLYLTN